MLTISGTCVVSNSNYASVSRVCSSSIQIYLFLPKPFANMMQSYNEILIVLVQKAKDYIVNIFIKVGFKFTSFLSKTNSLID